MPTGDTPRIAIVGAGVVGLACAYELSRRGADVSVCEASDVGSGASKGNTGWVAPSLSGPLAAPRVIRDVAGMLLKGSAPVSVRPSLDPSYLHWLWRFARNCSRTRFVRALDVMVALNRRTMDLFDEYRSEGVDFEMHESGLVVAGLSELGLRSYAELFSELERRGHRGDVATLDREEVCAIEPALSRASVVGGLHARVDRYVRPESLAAGLRDRLVERGVEVRTGVLVDAIERHRGRLRLRAADEVVEADRVVIAAGLASGRLLMPLGVRIPVVGAKGYSVTLERTSDSPRHALYLAEAKLGISTYADSTRIAGRFELGASDDRVNPRHIDQLVERSSQYFLGWRPGQLVRLDEWAGLRPATPDGMPIIGAVEGIEGLYVATGHGMLGVTLAAATAWLLGRLILDDELAPELQALRVERGG